MPSVIGAVVALGIVPAALAAPLQAQHAGHGAPPRPAASAPRTVPPGVFLPQESAGAVTLAVAPRWTDGRLVLLVGASTHAGDLATLDLKQAVRLVVNGATMPPDSAGVLSGHHARASVVFPLADRPTRFRVEIRGVSDVETRVLEWPAPQGAAPGSRD